MNDIRGLPLAIRCAAAAAAFNEALRAFAGNRADAVGQIQAAIGADEGFCLAHCLIAGYRATARAP